MEKFRSFLNEARKYEVIIKDDTNGEWPFPLEVLSLKESDIRNNIIRVLKKSKPTDWFEVDWLTKQYNSLDEAVDDISNRNLGPFYAVYNNKKIAELEIPVTNVWKKALLKKDFGRWLK